MKKVPTPFEKQDGAILIIALVFMLMLTIMAINTMDTSTLEIKMASSLQQQTIALSRAEATLLEAEEAIDTGAFSTTNNNDGYYLPTETINARETDWSSINSEKANTDDSRYIVQYLGARAIPGESRGMKKQTAGSEAYLHRVTVQSGAAKNASRQVQSLYVTDSAP